MNLNTSFTFSCEANSNKFLWMELLACIVWAEMLWQVSAPKFKAEQRALTYSLLSVSKIPKHACWLHDICIDASENSVRISGCHTGKQTDTKNSITPCSPLKATGIQGRICRLHIFKVEYTKAKCSSKNVRWLSAEYTTLCPRNLHKHRCENSRPYIGYIIPEESERERSGDTQKQI
jgi:hypothetical protein